LAAICVLASLLLSFNGAWADRVHWLEYSDALREARQKDRPVLLYFFSDQCPYCRKMDAQTFRSRRVVEYLRDAFVSVRIRAEYSPHLVRKYMVRGYPTSWFLTPAGRAILYVPGYQSPEQFTKVLRYIAGGHYKSRTLQEYLRGS
jgi:thioredoxin-related protein